MFRAVSSHPDLCLVFAVQLFHRHDKWFRNLPHCSLTNHKHTRMLSTSIFHPVVCILPAPVVLAPEGSGSGLGGWGGISKWEPLGIGVESQPVYGLGHISFWPDLKKPLRREPLMFSSKCINTQLSVTTLFAISLYFAWTHWSLEVTYGCVCTGAWMSECVCDLVIWQTNWTFSPNNQIVKHRMSRRDIHRNVISDQIGRSELPEKLPALWCIAGCGCESYQTELLDFVGFCLCVCLSVLMCVCMLECLDVCVLECLGVCVCTSLCLRVSRAPWSPLIPNLTDLLQRQPLMCAESLSGILDAVSIIFNSFSLIRNPLFSFHTGKHTYTYDARIVQQDRRLLCYEPVYTSGVFLLVLLFCNFTSLSSFNPILISCKPSNLWP